MRENEKLSTADLAAVQDRPRAGDEKIARVPVSPEPHGPQLAETNARVALFGDKDANDLRKQWADIQTGFVDEPRRAVEQADALVADAMSRLAQAFSSERDRLEKQWDRGDNITTEDLRVALQRYRSFFDRLLAA